MASRPGATVVFPHAGAAAASYRRLATALAAGGDTFIVQYPQRAERLGEPAPDTLHDLADGLLRAGPWQRVAPLRLFGHSMGAVVAFEFARIAEQHGVAVHKLWVSAGPVPSTVAGAARAADQSRRSCSPTWSISVAPTRGCWPTRSSPNCSPTRCAADYQALNRYQCGADGPHPRRHPRASAAGMTTASTRGCCAQWATHTAGRFTLSMYDGGHFYVNDHIDAVADRVMSDG